MDRFNPEELRSSLNRQVETLVAIIAGLLGGVLFAIANLSSHQV